MLSALVLMATMPVQSIGQGGTLALGNGVSVQRGGSTMESGAIILRDKDIVSLAADAKEKMCFIAPDNSIITFWPGARFRVEDQGRMNREDYVLLAGKYHAYSCPHGAPPGARTITLRTCCIQVWWPEQRGDLNLEVTVVGHEKCIVNVKTGTAFRQKTKGPVGYGAITTLGG